MIYKCDYCENDMIAYIQVRFVDKTLIQHENICGECFMKSMYKAMMDELEK